MSNSMSPTSLARFLRRRRNWRLPALVAGLTLPLAVSAFAAPATTDQALTRTLAQKPTSGWSSVIVKVSGDLTPVQEAQMTALGADITGRLSIIHSVALRVPTRNLHKLASLPFVTHLSSDGSVLKCDDFTDASSGAYTAFQEYGLTGKGITVAVVDSGIHQTDDMNGGSKLRLFNVGGNRLLARVDFSPKHNGGGQTGPGDDPCGHGTHVAGIIAGNGQKSSDNNCKKHFIGLAPAANLVSVRVLDGNGETDVSTVISGLQWTVSHAKQYNIRVINLSLGHPVGESYTTDPLCQAVEAAWKAGIVVVCAAGNDGRASTTNTAGAGNEGWGTNYGSIQSPGNDPYVITVGATKSMDGMRADDRIATYSSRGPSRLDLILKPDIIAPGNKIISVCSQGSYLDTCAGGTNDVPQSYYMLHQDPNHVSTDYFQLSGTSMASPVVAGAAALLLQANPTLTPDTIKARLMLSADKWTDPSGNGDALTYGAGYLNIPAALASKAIAEGPAASPSLLMDTFGNVSIDASRAVWGSSLWGTGVTDLRAVWGSRAVWDSSGITDLRAVWGSNDLAASRAVWGSSVWSDRAVWGSDSTAVDLTSTAIQGE